MMNNISRKKPVAKKSTQIKWTSSQSEAVTIRTSERNFENKLSELTGKLSTFALDDCSDSLINMPTDKDILDFKKNGVVFLTPKETLNDYLNMLNHILTHIETRYIGKKIERFKDVESLLRNQYNPKANVKINFLAKKIMTQQEKEFIETFEKVISKHLQPPINKIFNNTYNFKADKFNINNGIL